MWNVYDMILAQTFLCCGLGFGVWSYGNLIHVWVFFVVWSNMSSEKVLSMQVQLSTFEGLRADGLVGASSLLRQSCAQVTAGPNYPRMSVRAAVATGSPPALVSLSSFLFTSWQFFLWRIEWWKSGSWSLRCFCFVPDDSSWCVRVTNADRRKAKNPHQAQVLLG